VLSTAQPSLRSLVFMRVIESFQPKRHSSNIFFLGLVPVWFQFNKDFYLFYYINPHYY